MLVIHNVCWAARPANSGMVMVAIGVPSVLSHRLSTSPPALNVRSASIKLNKVKPPAQAVMLAPSLRRLANPPVLLVTQAHSMLPRVLPFARNAMVCSILRSSSHILITSFCLPLAGYSSPAQATTCTACAAGTYSNVVGAASCQPCQAGYFSGIAGAVACSMCPIAHYSLAGASVCADCEPGTYGNQWGQSSCRVRVFLYLVSSVFVSRCA